MYILCFTTLNASILFYVCLREGSNLILRITNSNKRTTVLVYLFFTRFLMRSVFLKMYFQYIIFLFSSQLFSINHSKYKIKDPYMMFIFLQFHYNLEVLNEIQPTEYRAYIPTSATATSTLSATLSTSSAFSTVTTSYPMTSTNSKSVERRLLTSTSASAAKSALSTAVERLTSILVTKKNINTSAQYFGQKASAAVTSPSETSTGP